ncbi:MAG: DUF2281 domain-containing protein [Lachnospiraceae bacterium]|nr:DUF2281 domain-containing protein [Lachnospiraceae bacterium]
MSAELLEAYETLPEDQKQEVLDFVMFLKNHRSHTQRILGIANGECVIPEDIDSCNAEIAEMFGVNQ